MSESEWKPPPEGSPCWVEIPAHDVAACKKFYAALFPKWTWKPATKDYPDDAIAMYSYAEPAGLTGGIVKVPADCKPGEQKNGTGFTVYFWVNSIEETKEHIEKLGGKAVTEKTPEGQHGFHMHCIDVAGNRFGIYTMKQ